MYTTVYYLEYFKMKIAMEVIRWTVICIQPWIHLKPKLDYNNGLGKSNGIFSRKRYMQN